MSSTSALFEALSNPALNYVNFNAFHRPIMKMSYVFLVQRVLHDKEDNPILGDVDDKVSVKVSTKMPEGAAAIYDSACNTIILPNHGYGGMKAEKAILVHEATHAVLDIYRGRNAKGVRVPMLVRDDEAVAYLAEAFYRIGLKISSGGRPGSPRRVAMSLAKSKLAGSAPPTSTLNFTARDLLPLQAAVQKDGLYSKDAQKRANHDGVDRRQACVVATF